MMRVFVPLLALAAVCNGILPEIVHSGISHILEDHAVMGQNELDRMFVKVEQLPGDPQHKPEDAFLQKNESVNTHPNDLPSSPRNESAADKVTDSESVYGTSVDQETNNITTSEQTIDLGNNIYQGCSSDKDCGKEMFCLSDDKNSKCLPCKTTDVPCTKDEECCGEQLCVWGQCTQNATKGEAGSTCQSQSDCSSDLCCAFHKTLLFPICSAKPIEREQCFGASNHLMALLSWDVQDEGPRKHCPCAGDLHCQHLGRGSMCLKEEDSSEEDLTDTLYSEIDYII